MTPSLATGEGERENLEGGLTRGAWPEFYRRAQTAPAG